MLHTVKPTASSQGAKPARAGEVSHAQTFPYIDLLQRPDICETSCMKAAPGSEEISQSRKSFDHQDLRRPLVRIRDLLILQPGDKKGRRPTSSDIILLFDPNDVGAPGRHLYDYTSAQLTENIEVTSSNLDERTKRSQEPFHLEEISSGSRRVERQEAAGRLVACPAGNAERSCKEGSLAGCSFVSLFALPSTRWRQGKGRSIECLGREQGQSLKGLLLPEPRPDTC
ncbi:hypothetical protein KM043_011298 [Ampulex compressa]|nr:hypothetical protein KM043_011298 [Ampulex compressa]